MPLSPSGGSLLPGKRLKVTCGLTACTPGSAPGPTLGNEYGRTLPFTLPFRRQTDRVPQTLFAIFCTISGGGTKSVYAGLARVFNTQRDVKTRPHWAASSTAGDAVQNGRGARTVDVVGPLAKFVPAGACLRADRRRGARGGGVMCLVVGATAAAAVLVKSKVHDRPLDGPLQHPVSADVFRRYGMLKRTVKRTIMHLRPVSYTHLTLPTILRV